MSIAEKLTTIAENTPKVYTAVYEKCKAEAQELLKFADTKLDKPSTDGTAGQVLTLADDGSTEWRDPSGGSGGTTDYEKLKNLPTINNIEIKGNLTIADLGIKDGKDGEDGEDYVLTEDDKQEIANIIKTDYDQELLDILGGD